MNAEKIALDSLARCLDSNAKVPAGIFLDCKGFYRVRVGKLQISEAVEAGWTQTHDKWGRKLAP